MEALSLPPSMHTFIGCPPDGLVGSFRPKAFSRAVPALPRYETVDLGCLGLPTAAAGMSASHVVFNADLSNLIALHPAIDGNRPVPRSWRNPSAAIMVKRVSSKVAGLHRSLDRKLFEVDFLESSGRARSTKNEFVGSPGDGQETATTAVVLGAVICSVVAQSSTPKNPDRAVLA